MNSLNEMDACSDSLTTTNSTNNEELCRVRLEDGPSTSKATSTFVPPEKVFFVHPVKHTPIVIESSEANLRANAMFSRVISEVDVTWTKKVDESVEDDLQFTASQRPAQSSSPPEPSPLSCGLKRPHESLKVVEDAFRTPENDTRKKRAAAGLLRPPRPSNNTSQFGIESGFIIPDGPSFSPSPTSESIRFAQQDHHLDSSVSVSSSLSSSSTSSGDSGHGSGFGRDGSMCRIISSSRPMNDFTQSELDEIASATWDCIIDDDKMFSELEAASLRELNAVTLPSAGNAAMINVIDTRVVQLTAMELQDIEEICHLDLSDIFGPSY